jgi:hypothetical protein
MSKNVVEPESPQITILRLRFVCWVRSRAHANTRQSACYQPPPPTHTHRYTHTEICNTYCFSMATMVMRTRLNVTLYVHCLSYYLLSSHALHYESSHCVTHRGLQIRDSFCVRTDGVKDGLNLVVRTVADVLSPVSTMLANVRKCFIYCLENIKVRKCMRIVASMARSLTFV